MAINNKGNRRLSMASFAGLFLLTLFLCCTAFVRTIKKTEKIPQEKLNLLMEKETVLSDFAELSRALCEFDISKQNGVRKAHKDRANADLKKENFYKKIITKDTANTYNDVLSFVQMADQYFDLIDQIGEESDERMKKCNQELKSLEKQNEILLGEKLKLELDILTKENEMAALIVELKSAKAAQSSGGGTPTVIPTPSKDCSPELNKYKSQIKLSIAMMKSDVQKVRSEVNKISPRFVGGSKSIQDQKKEIVKNILELENKINKIVKQ